MEPNNIYKRERSYVIEQCLHGEWVELITIPTEEITDKEFYEGLEDIIKNLIMETKDRSKCYLVISNRGIVFIPDDGPIRILQGS